jgi:hypothetical protein
MTASVLIAETTYTSATRHAYVSSAAFGANDNFAVRVWTFTDAAADSLSIASIAFEATVDHTASPNVWNSYGRLDLISGVLPNDGITLTIDGRQYPSLPSAYVTNGGVTVNVSYLSGSSPSISWDLLRYAAP